VQDASLMQHPFFHKGFFNPWPSVGEEDFQAFIIEAILQILLYLLPALVFPEADNSKGSFSAKQANTQRIGIRT